MKPQLKASDSAANDDPYPDAPLDYRAFPHIFDAILEDPGTWRALRGTGKAVKAMIDDRMYHHIVIRLATSDEVVAFRSRLASVARHEAGTEFFQACWYGLSTAPQMATHYLVTDARGLRLPGFPPSLYAHGYPFTLPQGCGVAGRSALDNGYSQWIKFKEAYETQRRHWSALLAKNAKVVDVHDHLGLPYHLAAALFGSTDLRLLDGHVMTPDRGPRVMMPAHLSSARRVVLWPSVVQTHNPTGLRVHSGLRKVVSHVVLSNYYLYNFVPLSPRPQDTKCSAEIVYIFSRSDYLENDIPGWSAYEESWARVAADILDSVQRSSRCRLVDLPLLLDSLPEDYTHSSVHRTLLDHLPSSVTGHTSSDSSVEGDTRKLTIECVSLDEYAATLSPDDFDLETKPSF